MGAKPPRNLIRVKKFEVVEWMQNLEVEDEKTGEKKHEMRHVLVIFAQGEDGILYEFNGRTWLPLPIEPGRIAENPMPPKAG